MPDNTASLAHKPTLTNEQITALLHEHFSGAISDLIPLSGGQIAQTLTFTADGQKYVIRFNKHMGANFEKEAWVYERIAASQLPIPMPPIIRVGRLDELHYALSRYIPGQCMHTLPRAEYEQVIPELIETIHAIHLVNVSDTSGYGVIGDDGNGLFSSWHAELKGLIEEEEEWNFYGKWHTLFQTTFLDRDLFYRLYQQMVHLLDFCPQERYLVHSGCGFGNVLVHNGHISGVLDWIEARYGDFIYDIAVLDLWDRESRFPERFQRFYAERGISIEHFNERLQCYKLYIGMDALRFFAKTQQRASYDWVCQRLTQ